MQAILFTYLLLLSAIAQATFSHQTSLDLSPFALIQIQGKLDGLDAYEKITFPYKCTCLPHFKMQRDPSLFTITDAVVKHLQIAKEEYRALKKQKRINKLLHVDDVDNKHATDIRNKKMLIAYLSGYDKGLMAQQIAALIESLKI